MFFVKNVEAGAFYKKIPVINFALALFYRSRIHIEIRKPACPDC